MDRMEEAAKKLGLASEKQLSDEQKASIVKEIISVFERERLTYGQSADLLELTHDALGAQMRFVKLVQD